ncbi:MAG: hypothetical protein APF78_00580 [Sphingomonadales bacterium BRH_c3]|nr:MAG: hypothetical protein APF78_00580 [Sphingomonadales bacterium BRH_c3]
MQNDSRMGAAPLLALLIVGSGVAFAQEAEAQEADPEALAALPTNERARTNDTASAEIIVTAQRRSENLIDVPLSVSIITSKALESSGITNFRELTAVTPAMNIAAVGGYVQPTIRGVTTTVIGIGQENNIATYVDGFYQPNPLALNRDLKNIESIQVLKGPQGTLFGRNATGGAILVKTLDPSYNRRSLFNLSYGRFNEVVFSGYHTQGLSDHVAIDIGGSLRRSDNYVKDIGGYDTAPIRNSSISSKVLVEPTDSLKVVANFRYDKVSNAVGFAVTGTDYLLAKRLFPDVPIVEGVRNRTSLTPFLESSSEMYGGYLTAHLQIADEITLASFTRYDKSKDLTHFDQDYSPIKFIDIFQRLRQRNASEELTLSYNSGPLDLVIGSFYFDSNSSKPFFAVQVSPDPSVPTVDQASWLKTKSIAAYADGTYRITPRFTLTAGLRYSWEQKEYHFEAPPGNTIVESAVKAWDSVSPRLALTYGLLDDTNLYLSWSKGFKSGTYNTGVPSTEPINPESITAFEFGIKGRSNRVFFSTAAYYYDYSDLQVSATIQENGVALTKIINAASSEIYGIEAELSAEIADRLNLHIGTAYSHARYKEFEGAPVFFLNQLTQLRQRGVQDWSDRRALRAPDWTGNLLVDYMLPSSIGNLNFSGNLSFSSRFAPTTAQFDPETGKGSFEQKPYARLNLRVAWELQRQLSLALYVRNVTDVNVLQRTEASTTGDFRVYEEPRVYGVSLNFEF